jgi:hypothetical protein
MKDCLLDLENVKLLRHDDLDIIDQKRILRQRIAEPEREGSAGDELTRVLRGYEQRGILTRKRGRIVLFRDSSKR